MAFLHKTSGLISQVCSYIWPAPSDPDTVLSTTVQGYVLLILEKRVQLSNSLKQCIALSLQFMEQAKKSDDHSWCLAPG